MVDGAVVDAAVVLGTVVAEIEADVVEGAAGVLVGGVVTVVLDDPVVVKEGGTSVACPAVEQATISSRDPTFNRIGIP